MDFALIAQAATPEARIPFMHFFDGFRRKLKQPAALSNSWCFSYFAPKSVGYQSQRTRRAAIQSLLAGEQAQTLFRV
jgi:hypothetical protein